MKSLKLKGLQKKMGVKHHARLESDTAECCLDVLRLSSEVEGNWISILTEIRLLIRRGITAAVKVTMARARLSALETCNISACLRSCVKYGERLDFNIRDR